MKKIISIRIENSSEEDITVNLFDNREWNAEKKVTIKNNYPQLSYDDILHNLIKNDIIIYRVFVSGHSGEGLSYLFNLGKYDYKKNPLNTVVQCISYDVFGSKTSLPISVETVENQQQTTIVGSENFYFKIGNSSYLEYTSKAKTNVDFYIYAQ